MHRQECVGFYTKWHLLITLTIVILIQCTPKPNPSEGPRAAHGRIMRSIKLSKGVDESFFPVRGRLAQRPHTHAGAAGKVCLWRPIFHGQPIRDHYRLEQQPISKKVEASRWQECIFPMPGHFIFKIIISSIRKVNRAIGYLKCQSPNVASFNRKMVFCRWQFLTFVSKHSYRFYRYRCTLYLYMYEEMAWMDNE